MSELWLTNTQVCRRLKDASHDRSVWLSLFVRYSTDLEPQIFYPERPLNEHTSEELERLLLKWQAVDLTWKQDDISPTLHHQFSVENGISDCFHLVKGGRWLLVGTTRGEIIYFDLNAPVPSPCTLLSAALNSHSPRIPAILLFLVLGRKTKIGTQKIMVDLLFTVRLDSRQSLDYAHLKQTQRRVRQRG